MGRGAGQNHGQGDGSHLIRIPLLYGDDLNKVVCNNARVKQQFTTILKPRSILINSIIF